MRSSYRKCVSLLILATFIVMSVGAYGLGAKWLAHEFDHAQASLDVLADHDHTPSFDAQGSPHPEPLSDAEHKQLHAYGHAEQFVSTDFDGPAASSVHTVPSRPELLSVLPSVLESPFRPPRSASLL